MRIPTSPTAELCTKFETDLACNGGDAQDPAAVNLQANVDIPETVKGFERVSLRSRHSVDLDGKYFDKHCQTAENLGRNCC